MNRGNALLGVIEWYSPWERWSLSPVEYTRFSDDCMQDILHFINQLKEMNFVAKFGQLKKSGK